VIEAKDILGWCFTIAALDFGVFGFLYSVYAAASFQVSPTNPVRPPITRYLRRFCQVVILVLIALTTLAAVTSYRATAGYETWLIIACFAVLTLFSMILAYKME
jgi:hypothetical protein